MDHQTLSPLNMGFPAILKLLSLKFINRNIQFHPENSILSLVIYFHTFSNNLTLVSLYFVKKDIQFRVSTISGPTQKSVSSYIFHTTKW